MRVVRSLSRSTRYTAALVLIAGVLASSAVAGCSSTAASFCNDRCDCEGNCSTNTRQSCIKTQDDNEKVANDVGCGSQWDVFASCVVGRAQCIGGKYTTGGCDTEASNVGKCLVNNPGHPCALIGESIHCL